MTIYDAIRDIHIFAGTIALAAFWTAATLRKGSTGHRLVGRTFLISMLMVSITGVAIAVVALSRGRLVFASFLLYLVLITGTACWLAWRAVRDKRDFARFTGRLYHALAWAHIVGGVAMLAIGIHYQRLIIGALSLVGLIVGPLMLRSARAQPESRQGWLARHYGFILGAGAGVHIAFLNLGLARLLPPEFGVIAERISWFAPFGVALIARWWLDRQYGPRTRGPRSTDEAAAIAR
jgi:hypothetical protein